MMQERDKLQAHGDSEAGAAGGAIEVVNTKPAFEQAWLVFQRSRGLETKVC